MELPFSKTYICPICLIKFSEEALSEKVKNNLTLEDAPPKSLGGSQIALTCKKCNNTCGHKVDFHLSVRLRELDERAFKPNTTQRVTLARMVKL
ncbi:HNH endonuclease [Adhaeribacter radiodurans]|uniref:HNH endonuclease n=1 Tax=Adhaeribacter radiodurans TaxID=2745197 RepID=UPI0037436B64